MRYDAMDHRAGLGGGHYWTHVHSGSKMAGMDRVTCHDSAKGLSKQWRDRSRGRMVAWSLSQFSL